MPVFVPELSIRAQVREPGTSAGMAPEALLAEVPQLGADAPTLAGALRDRPDLHDAILGWAAGALGNGTVTAALAMLAAGGSEQAAGGGERAAGGGERAAGGGEQAAALVSGDADPGAAERAEEPRWVAGARAYNAVHADAAMMFDELTEGVCRGADGALDPLAIAAWQESQGMHGDGRVTPETVATAGGSGFWGPAAAATTGPAAGAPLGGADAETMARLKRTMEQQAQAHGDVGNFR